MSSAIRIDASFNENSLVLKLGRLSSNVSLPRGSELVHSLYEGVNQFKGSGSQLT